MLRSLFLLVLSLKTTVVSIPYVPALVNSYKHSCDRSPFRTVYLGSICFAAKGDVDCDTVLTYFTHEYENVFVTSMDSVEGSVKDALRKITDESRDYCPISINLNCPSGYEMFEDYCYRIMEGTQTYDSAQRTCQGEGGHLPLVETDDVNQYLREIVDDKIKAPIWLGIRYQNSVWGYDQKEGDILYYRWMHFNKGDTNAVIDYGIYGGYWRSESSSKSHRFVCQKSAKNN